jgi:hypothetical protein
MKTIAALFLALLLTAAPAQTLPGGTYTCTPEFGAVLLDGRYPLALSETPGSLELHTSPTGVLSGKAVFFGQTFDVTGTIKERLAYIRIVLRGRLGNKRFLLKATLQGSAFVGTAQLGRLRTPCSFDVAATGTTRPVYALTLAVAANGVIKGTGSLSAGHHDVIVTARGRVIGERVLLTITGGRTLLRTTTGKLNATGFNAAKWLGQGFGALTSSVNLRVTKNP